MSNYSDCGVIYVATGDRFIEEARHSAESVKNHCPDIPITLFSDKEVSISVFDDIMKVHNARHDFGDKIRHIMRSPYDRTIFLDSDTTLIDGSGIHDLLDLLDEFQIALSHDTSRSVQLRTSPSEEVPNSFPMFNSGVIGFRNTSDVQNAFEEYLQLYLSQVSEYEGVNDQKALRTSLYRNDLRITVLPPEYNYRIPYPQFVSDRVKILHGRASNIEKIAQEINEFNGAEQPRIYHPVHLGHTGLPENRETIHLISPHNFEIQFEKHRISLQQEGILNTFLHISLGGIEKGRFRKRMVNDSISENGVLSTVRELFGWLKGEDFSI